MVFTSKITNNGNPCWICNPREHQIYLKSLNAYARYCKQNQDKLYRYQHVLRRLNCANTFMQSIAFDLRHKVEQSEYGDNFTYFEHRPRHWQRIMQIV